MPPGDDLARLRRQPNCRSWDPDKDRKEVVCKNISGSSREYASITRHHGNTNTGREGVGMSHFQQLLKAAAAERRTMVQAEVRRTEEDQRKARSTELEKQGAWMKWDLPERELKWAELWRKDQFRLSAEVA